MNKKYTYDYGIICIGGDMVGDVLEFSIIKAVKAVKEAEKLSKIIKEKRKKSEEFKNELFKLTGICYEYNLKIEDYYIFEDGEKPGWG